ncbi:MAG: sulfotransferase [Gammaproteobacteria bacterium]|nr:sulfotransferase [Gammaproteobacteria bacterium]NNF62186.1 sulfotransferase [Gammaproteobacteria bacterium]NNM20129.1 sulfotransferase [Gammaproteobacteria bacterium]
MPWQTSLDPEQLQLTAARRTGLTDFGGASWRDGFERLCSSLEDEAQLTPTGRLAARNHLLQLLANRLQLQAERQRNSYLRGQNIDAPVLITGLPRSGSTLLHELMAQDPAIRVPFTWEVMLPCRLPGQPEREMQRRIDRTDRMLRWVDRLAPQFKSVHAIGARLPQECIAITAHQFASVEFHTTFNVPGYQSWLDQQDGMAAAQYHRQFLQHLQAANDRGRWILKAPAHLYTLPALARVYPGARFVYTRRDPEQVAASIASHGVILRNAFSDAVDAAAVAGFWMRWWAEGWRRGESFRQHNAVLLIDYETLVADPLAAVGSLYEQLGLPLTADSENRMRQYLAANPQGKFGRHRYSLQQFGLDPATIRDSFGA